MQIEAQPLQIGPKRPTLYLVFLVIVIVIAGLSEEILKWHTLLLFEGIYGHWNGNFTLKGHLPTN